MKHLRLYAVMAGVAFLGGAGLIQGAESCCDRARAKGEQCTHKCCVKAAKKGKVCEVCNSKEKNEQKK